MINNKILHTRMYNDNRCVRVWERLSNYEKI